MSAARSPQTVGTDDGLVRAIEIVVTPIIFAGIGWAVDRVLGTTPVFLFVFATVALAGKFLAEYYRYTHLMGVHEAELLAERPALPRRIERVELPDGRLPVGVTLDADRTPHDPVFHDAGFNDE